MQQGGRPHSFCSPEKLVCSLWQLRRHARRGQPWDMHTAMPYERTDDRLRGVIGQQTLGAQKTPLTALGHQRCFSVAAIVHDWAVESATSGENWCYAFIRIAMILSSWINKCVVKEARLKESPLPGKDGRGGGAIRASRITAVVVSLPQRRRLQVLRLDRLVGMVRRDKPSFGSRPSA